MLHIHNSAHNASNVLLFVLCMMANVLCLLMVSDCVLLPGFRIFEELPVPINSDNFCVLFMFALNFLLTNWARRESPDSECWKERMQVMSMLTVISTRVETSIRTEYHLEKALVLAHRFYSELPQQHQNQEHDHQSESESEQKSGQGQEQRRDRDIFHSEAVSVLFEFLSSMIPLHHSHAGLIHTSGFLTIALEHIIDLICVLEKEEQQKQEELKEEQATSTISETKTEIGTETAEGFVKNKHSNNNKNKKLQQVKHSLGAAIHLLTSCLSCADVLAEAVTPRTLFPQLELSHLTTLLQIHGGVFVREAVCLFVTTFGHFLTCQMNEAEVEADVETFMTEYLDQGIRMFQQTPSSSSSGAEYSLLVNSERRESGIGNSDDIGKRYRGMDEVNGMNDSDGMSSEGRSLKPLNARKDFWTSLRILARDAYLLGVLEMDNFATQRALLVRVIERLLHHSTAEMGKEEKEDGVLGNNSHNICHNSHIILSVAEDTDVGVEYCDDRGSNSGKSGGSGCNSGDSFDMDLSGIMCVDAMAALGGWIDNCWRDSLVIDRQVTDILAATHVKFLKKDLVDDGDGDGGDNFTASDSGSDSASRGRDRNRRIGASGSSGGEGTRVSGEEKLMKLRTSFCTLDIEISPVSEEQQQSLSESQSESQSDLDYNNDSLDLDGDRDTYRDRDLYKDMGRDEVTSWRRSRSRSSTVSRRTISTRGEIDTADVVDFLVDWEVESTACVCYKVMKLLGVSRNHPLGLVSLEGMDLVGLAEVLIELLSDDRHGMSEEEGMQEKCIQLLTDILPLSDSIGTLAAEQVEVIMEILCDWSNFTDTFLVQSCLSALIAMAHFSHDTRRHIVENLDKIQVLFLHVNNPIFLLAVLELCCAIMPSFKKTHHQQEMLMFNWIMQCLSFRTKPMIMRCCQLIHLISLENRPFIGKVCSRYAIEKAIIHVVSTSDDKELVVAALRTLTILANNFNKNPFWVHNRWLSLPSHCTEVLSKHRELSSPDFMTSLLHLQYKFEEPFNLIILAYSLEIISTIRCLPATHFGDVVDANNYACKFYSVFMPLVAGLLAMITRSHSFCEVAEDVDEPLGPIVSADTHTQTHSHSHSHRTSHTQSPQREGEGDATGTGGTGGGQRSASRDDTSTSTTSTTNTSGFDDHADTLLSSHPSSQASPPSSPAVNLYDDLMTMRLEAINPVYELLGASVVNSLHSLITSLDDQGNMTLDTYFSLSGLFSLTPICESIIYIMIQLPNNFVAQVKGIIALEALLSRGIGTRILAECCTRVLTSAIISFVDDGEVHLAFCSIVNILSNRDEGTKASMVAAGVHKWLYVVIKSASLASSPLACHAIYNLINNSEENTEIIGHSGIIRPTLLLLEKRPDDLKVQFEGLRLITALCKTKAVFRKIKENKGEGAITAARKMLTGVYKNMLIQSRPRGSMVPLSTTTTIISTQTDFRRSSSMNSDNRSDKKSRRGSDVGASSETPDVLAHREAECEGPDLVNFKTDIDIDTNVHEEKQENDVKDHKKEETKKGQLEYSKEDIKHLLDISTPMKLSQQKCVIM